MQWKKWFFSRLGVMAFSMWCSSEDNTAKESELATVPSVAGNNSTGTWVVDIEEAKSNQIRPTDPAMVT